MNKNDTKKLVACCAIRSGKGGGKFYSRGNAYILLCEDGVIPSRIDMRRQHATARVSVNVFSYNIRLQAHMEKLCAEYNSGLKTWREVVDAFFNFDARRNRVISEDEQ